MLANIFSLEEPTFKGKNCEVVDNLLSMYFDDKKIMQLLAPEFKIIALKQYTRTDKPHPGFSMRTEEHQHQLYFIMAKRSL